MNFNFLSKDSDYLIIKVEGDITQKRYKTWNGEYGIETRLFDHCYNCNTSFEIGVANVIFSNGNSYIILKSLISDDHDKEKQKQFFELTNKVLNEIKEYDDWKILEVIQKQKEIQEGCMCYHCYKILN